MDKPLHVQVAEALGWTEVGLDESPYGLPPAWVGTTPDRKTFLLSIPRYDTDWSATGPLIESKHIHIEPFYHPYYVHPKPDSEQTYRWSAWTHRIGLDYKWSLDATGDTALIAVCNLILILAEERKPC